MDSNNTFEDSTVQAPAGSAAEALPAVTRFTTWTTKSVGQIGWALVGLAILVRVIVTASGAFYWDDFILQGRAARLPLNTDFLIHSHDGHIMPMAALVSWLSERAAPLEFWLPALTMIAMQVAVAVLGWLLLRRMFGSRPLVLLPLLVYLFSMITLPSAVWWTASLNALPMQLGMLAVTWGAWLMCREDRERAGRIWAVVGIVGALLFFEKSLLLGLWLVCIVWLLSDHPKPRAWVAEQWRERKWFWVLLLAFAIGYVGVYASVSDRSASAAQSVGGLAGALASAIFEAILPSLIGGPGSWEPIGWGNSFAKPSVLVMILAAVAVFALVAFAIRCAPRGARAWLAAFVYTIAVSALMASTRLVGKESSQGMTALRYTADTLLPLVLAIGLSVMPLAGDKDSVRMRAFRAAAIARPKALLIGVIAVLTVTATIATASVTSFWGIWSNIAAEPWLANARATMAAGADDGPVLNQQIPEFVISGLAYPYSNADWALAPLPRRPAFAEFTNNPRFLLSNGTLVAGTVAGIATKPGSAPNCGWHVGPGTTKLQFTASAFDWEHRLELDYLARSDTPATVQYGIGRTVPIQLLAGPHRLVVTIEGGGSEATIAGVPTGSNVCISRAVVGNWQPLPASP